MEPDSGPFKDYRPLGRAPFSGSMLVWQSSWGSPPPPLEDPHPIRRTKKPRSLRGPVNPTRTHEECAELVASQAPVRIAVSTIILLRSLF